MPVPKISSENECESFPLPLPVTSRASSRGKRAGLESEICSLMTVAVCLLSASMAEGKADALVFWVGKRK